jgi:hypothetical protein
MSHVRRCCSCWFKAPLRYGSTYDNFIANGRLAVQQPLKLQKRAREFVDNEYGCERKFY